MSNRPPTALRATIVAAIAVSASMLAGPAFAEEDAAPASRVEVGKVAPDFTLEATDGTEHQLSALRGEKSAVLVFFRGAW